MDESSLEISVGQQVWQPAPSMRAYVACYVSLGLMLGLMLAGRYFGSPIPDNADPADADRSAVIDQRIDPNTATWGELTTLPGIGEVLAKRIADYREQQAKSSSADGQAVVFHSPGDLEAVRGIGPKTVAKMTPFLRFPEPPETSSRPAH